MSLRVPRRRAASASFAARMVSGASPATVALSSAARSSSCQSGGDLRDESRRLQFRCVVQLGGEQHMEQPGAAEPVRQEVVSRLRQAVADGAGDRDPESRPGGADPDIARRGQHEPSADGVAANHRDGRDPYVCEPADDGFDLLLVGLTIVAGGERGEGTDVGACGKTESPLPRSTRQRTVSSASAEPHAAASASYIPVVRALAERGRLNATVSTGPSRAVSTSGAFNGESPSRCGWPRARPGRPGFARRAAADAGGLAWGARRRSRPGRAARLSRCPAGPP